MNAIDEWSRAQERVLDLVQSVPGDRWEATVPACPDWTARNLLSHMIGLNADVLAGEEADDHNADWTQKQVDDRQNATVEDLAAEWRSLTDPMRTWMAENNTRPLGDAIIHEQDLRGALGVTGAQDSEGLQAMRDKLADGLGDAVKDLPPLELRGARWTWLSQPEAGTPEVVLSAPDFELIRALMTRRSEAQLRSWTVEGDIGPYLDHFGTMGSLPDTDLSETFE
ncbi:hypothetical protein GCM10007304_16000 [Rhodococcoides trifolii]|uniref:Mycothiol-dependent maleylpyruvate isomerase metal-binding domain-containing protein n=1 Tax=Rhodococcoides trifolii TaxID=908250 RepID=A0A917D164_9NOCA|nr:maleylpyruvate isomerase family mycothiol-dependent enzyme [Rhodococcus trifolii]GGG02744.1 hypothetical protein GCM10007304_16000 [Rhodococcus trifolii]